MPMNMAEDLHRLGGTRYFSKIDFRKGSWQIPVPEQDIYKTALMTPDGQYELLRRSFEMVNARAVLVWTIEILKGMSGVQSYISYNERNPGRLHTSPSNQY